MVTMIYTLFNLLLTVLIHESLFQVRIVHLVQICLQYVMLVRIQMKKAHLPARHVPRAIIACQVLDYLSNQFSLSPFLCGIIICVF